MIKTEGPVLAGPSARDMVLVVASVVGLVSGLVGLAGAWLVLPYRVSQLEIQVQRHVVVMQRLTESATVDHELLVRIDERLLNLQTALARLEEARRKEKGNP